MRAPKAIYRVVVCVYHDEGDYGSLCIPWWGGRVVVCVYHDEGDYCGLYHEEGGRVVIYVYHDEGDYCSLYTMMREVE